MSPRIALAQSFAYEAESGDHGFDPISNQTPFVLQTMECQHDLHELVRKVRVRGKGPWIA